MNALERLGRKRRERREQPHPQSLLPFTIEGCDCLDDGAWALIRIAGTGTSTPTALVAESETYEAFEPLPQPRPEEPDSMWRVAFAIPSELTGPGTRLWLHDDDMYRAEVLLPGAKRALEVVPDPAPPVLEAAAPEPEPEVVAAPKPVAARRPAPSPVTAADEEAAATDPRARKLVEAWSEAALLREKLADREEELADALQELLAARTDVQPLRIRAKEAADELAAMREELELAHKQGRDARLRTTQKAAELDALRTQLGAAEPRVAEAERAAELAQQETSSLREQVQRLEAELAAARAEVQTAIGEAEAKIASLTAQAESERGQHASASAEHQQVAEKLQSKLEKLEAGKSRRRGLGRRTEDRALAEVRAELEARIAEQQQRIAELEHEATSFTERREDAVAGSLREQIEKLEEELRQNVSTNEDLRALLASERELAASARGEMHDLRRQLATASAGRGAAAAATETESEPEGTGDASSGKATQSPPWSALDDELLARIEKAKALTG
ncbi:MAG: hypothetical protein QOF55_1229 [Thermoleophilaceae bacterium]|nr:hypothetical protein [Thermoleophilaceae bacterium]